MTTLAGRIKKLESRLNERRPRRIEVISVDDGEEPAEALDGNAADIRIIITKFSGWTPPQEPERPPETVDAQIEGLVAELEAEGFTLQQIADAVAAPAPPAPKNNAALDIQPITFEALGPLFKRRGFRR